MNTQDELKEFFINSFIPIDNIPENTAWRNSISMEARASMLIDNASLEELSSLFNVCINENVLTLQLPVPLSVQITAPTTFPAPTTVGYTYVDVCYSWNFSSYCITRTETTTDYFQISGRWHIKDSLFERNECEKLLARNLQNAEPSFPWTDSKAADKHRCINFYINKFQIPSPTLRGVAKRPLILADMTFLTRLRSSEIPPLIVLAA